MKYMYYDERFKMLKSKCVCIICYEQPPGEKNGINYNFNSKKRWLCNYEECNKTAGQVEYNIQTNLRSTYQNRISENHNVDMHKNKISTVQTDRHGPDNNGV